MGEQQIVLKDEPDPSALWNYPDAVRYILQHFILENDASIRQSEQSGQRAKE
jgi:hypothetical protein